MNVRGRSMKFSFKILIIYYKKIVLDHGRTVLFLNKYKKFGGLFVIVAFATSSAFADILGDCDPPYHDFIVRVDEKTIELVKDVKLLGPENLIDLAYFDELSDSNGKISILALPPVGSFVIDANTNSVTANGETYPCKIRLVGKNKSEKVTSNYRDEAIAQVEKLIKDFSITASDLHEITVLRILKPLFEVTK